MAFSTACTELKELVDRFPEVDKTMDRHEYHFLLTQLTEEFNHYVMLADILEHVMGRKMPRILCSCPKKRSWATCVGATLTTNCPAAVGFTEGGGARLFREGAKLSGDTVNDMTAKAMKIIYDDEKDHYAEQGKDRVELIKTGDDLARMKDAIRDISVQRVRMRAENVPWRYDGC